MTILKTKNPAKNKSNSKLRSHAPSVRSETHLSVINTPFGKIGLTMKDGVLINLDLYTYQATKAKKSEDAKPVIEQLEAYFENPKHVFQVDLAYHSTEHQHKVWDLLRTIPSGKTLTYGTVAKILETGPRAVGQACRTNRIPVIIPCHRIVAANSIGGFMGVEKGSFIAIKKWLLQHEGIDKEAPCLPR